MDFYTAVQHTPAWVLILGLVMLCILACIFFPMRSARKLHAFQLASRWSANELYYRRKNDGTWQPWVELWHEGNFDPNDNEKCYRPGCTGKMINQASRSENHKAYDIYVCNICGSAKGVEVNNMGRR